MRGLAIVSILFLSGCATANTTPLAQNMVQISARSAPVCGSAGAQKAMFRQAAVETINRGFDRFVILGAQNSSQTVVAGTTPVTAHATGTANANIYGNSVYATGQSRTVVTGGQPIYATNHGSEAVVKMFKADDPQAVNALDARTQLGPKWQEIAASPKRTCL